MKLFVKFFDFNNIYSLYENKTLLDSHYGDVVIYNDGMGTWSIRKYEENKKIYWMETVYQSNNIFDFAYWLNSNIAC